jgi:hypothetical protein
VEGGEVRYTAAPEPLDFAHRNRLTLDFYA